MPKKTLPKKELYFTHDHEWIDFQGAVAYTGICWFKLIGIKEIQRIVFTEPAEINKQGDIIAVVYYNEYRIEVHMPVDGKILELNDALLFGNKQILLQQSESSGWIALIIPDQPLDRTGLLLPRQYQWNKKMNVKR